jgi:L-fuculose-phosphate aldolase
MHLLIYKSRPDVRGIVHAHPCTATGFAAAGSALNQPLVCEVVIGLGSIPWPGTGHPGTELWESLEPLIPQYDAILMSNHGVVTYADTLHRAYMKMETVEHFAQIALVTHRLGRQRPLGQEEPQKLLLARSKYEGTHPVAAMPLAALSRFPGGRSSAACGQTLTDHVEPSGIVQPLVDGIQQIVFEQGRLFSQGGVEEPSLVGGGDLSVIEYIE